MHTVKLTNGAINVSSGIIDDNIESIHVFTGLWERLGLFCRVSGGQMGCASVNSKRSEIRVSDKPVTQKRVWTSYSWLVKLYFFYAMGFWGSPKGLRTNIIFSSNPTRLFSLLVAIRLWLNAEASRSLLRFWHRLVVTQESRIAFD